MPESSPQPVMRKTYASARPALRVKAETLPGLVIIVGNSTWHHNIMVMIMIMTVINIVIMIIMLMKIRMMMIRV